MRKTNKFTTKFAVHQRVISNIRAIEVSTIKTPTFTPNLFEGKSGYRFNLSGNFINNSLSNHLNSHLLKSTVNR